MLWFFLVFFFLLLFSFPLGVRMQFSGLVALIATLNLLVFLFYFFPLLEVLL